MTEHSLDPKTAICLLTGGNRLGCKSHDDLSELSLMTVSPLSLAATAEVLPPSERGVECVRGGRSGEGEEVWQEMGVVVGGK